MPGKFVAPRTVAAAAFAATLLVAAPVAWAVGWTTVGAAGNQLNDTGMSVTTGGTVYSSAMRLYVTAHPDCGGENFWMQYLKPDGSVSSTSSIREICFAGESPSSWSVAGGNKYASCGELFAEPDDPTSTCQRDSTT
jgi:hypothetical protein